MRCGVQDQICSHADSVCDSMVNMVSLLTFNIANYRIRCGLCAYITL